MSLDYLISPEARDDIDDTHTWYESQATGRGDTFLVELTEMITNFAPPPRCMGA